MSGETERPPQLDSALLERFKADVKRRKGRLRGNYSSELEAALEAYLDGSQGGDTNDRLARIEEQLDRVEGHLVEKEGKKKKESSDTSSTTESRLRKITNTIADETANSPKVHTQVVEKAIRAHAGSSDPTIRRYKELLQQDNQLFSHPTKDTLYFRDSTEYVLAVNAMAKGGKLQQQDYDAIVERFGEEWWLEQQPTEERPTGFQ